LTGGGPRAPAGEAGQRQTAGNPYRPGALAPCGPTRLGVSAPEGSPTAPSRAFRPKARSAPKAARPPYSPGFRNSTLPWPPFTRTRSPVLRRIVASLQPTTAGMPSSRATMAACESGAPTSVTMAAARGSHGAGGQSGPRPPGRPRQSASRHTWRQGSPTVAPPGLGQPAAPALGPQGSDQ
jgi:hypothetical protein